MLATGNLFCKYVWIVFIINICKRNSFVASNTVAPASKVDSATEAVDYDDDHLFESEETDDADQTNAAHLNGSLFNSFNGTTQPSSTDQTVLKKKIKSHGSAKTGKGQCVMFGQCNQKLPEKTFQNCQYDGAPMLLEDAKALDILKSLCPALLKELQQDNLDGPLHLCCDSTQIFALERSLSVPQQFLFRCPSCFRNFANLWCQSTCHPMQADFLHVTDTLANRDTSYAYVAAMEYYITENYIDGLYNSCKNVQFPGSNQKAISLMCGADGGHCTISKWLQFLGDTQVNVMAPFDIKFKLQSGSQKMTTEDHREMKPQNSSIIPCNKAPDAESSPCSCQDCAQSCNAIVPYPKPATGNCLVAGRMDCWVFVSLLAFGSLCLITILMTVLHCILAASTETHTLKHSSSAGLIMEKGDFALKSDSYADNIADFISPSELSFWQQLGAWVEEKLEDVFISWGVVCTRHPIVVFLFGLVVSLICSSGLYFMEVTTDPVKLWSAPGSRARFEKEFFDENFGPFYRTEQIIIVPKNQVGFDKPKEDSEFDKERWGSVFYQDFLINVLHFQREIMELHAELEDGGRNITLNDICFKPLAPNNNHCAVFSVLQYFQLNETLLTHTVKSYNKYGVEKISDYTAHLLSCFKGPTQVSSSKMKLSCMANFGAPVFPYLVLGGFEGEDYQNANALVLTFVVQNHNQEEKNRLAEAWELKFIEFVRDYKHQNMTVDFIAERSIQDEINRESQSDVATILISYTVMFLYIAFSLGQYSVYDNNLFYLLIQSKILLGFVGTLIVMLSVTSSVGVYAYFGIPATLIIVEVVPFLVLAVGVDNIFILVQAYQRDRPMKNEGLEERIGRISGEVIPSMMLSSLSECFCFFLGALSSMPAVKVFSLYAALAIFFDFFLQVTCFLALFTLDVRRQESGRLELCCCARLPPPTASDTTESDGFMLSFVRDYYAPLLLTKFMRITVFLVFLAWLFSSLAVVNKIEIGLDQKLSMPRDSYVLKYFEAMTQYLSVGPPVYFVIKGQYDYSRSILQDRICGSSGCNQDSLCGQIYVAAHYRNRSYLAHPVSSWLDDYYDWLRPVGDPPCCRKFFNESFCSATVNATKCYSCDVKFTGGRPPSKDFYYYINDFLNDNPTTMCSKGGHAAYGNALSFDEATNRKILASYFMTYHTVLKSSSDYINAIKNARMVAGNISETINKNLPNDQQPIEVFPYSIFYVFYEQYLTLVHDAVIQLVLSIAAIFGVASVLLGMDPWSGAIIVVTISSMLLNMLGLMYWWSIHFNAISLVNLVMTIGIGVEFCAHIVRSFSVSVQSTRLERSHESLSTMGSSVLSGITLTKFGGIIVLAFSHSQIFQVFYFRMYLGIVVFGALHGLVFLPVLLSFVGPPLNKHRLMQYQRHQLRLALTETPSAHSLMKVCMSAHSVDEDQLQHDGFISITSPMIGAAAAATV